MRDSPPMQSSDVGRFARRSAIGFVTVVVAALALAVAVQAAGGPVVGVDRAVAADLNAVVAPRPWLVTTLLVLTAPGSAVTAWIVLTILTVVLLVRRKLRLALYVAVTGLGAATLSPLLKQLVDRLRPVVDVPVATAGGPSFPSGHTLAATVWVGTVLLVLLPVVPAHRRRLAVAIGVALVVVVGLTRIALGVHFVSDVLGGWLVGGGWLLATATAFRAWRRHEGLAVPAPVDGLAPEVAHDLTPPHVREHLPDHPWTTVAQLFVAAVLLLGALVGVGLLLTHVDPGSGFLRADVGVDAWLADHRIPALDALSVPLAEMGNTGIVVGGGVVAAVVTYVATRRWRPVLVIVTALTGEVLIFLATTAVVGRPRPPVPHLDATLPPTSSFPSGHTAAAICLYGTIAALVLRGTRAWWRWPVLGVAVVLIAAVAFARLYRGAHHPTDVLASAAFAIPWLLVTLRLVGDDPGERAGPDPVRQADPAGGRVLQNTAAAEPGGDAPVR
jgi:undecaprenyl-diphosphatase